MEAVLRANESTSLERQQDTEVGGGGEPPGTVEGGAKKDANIVDDAKEVTEQLGICRRSGVLHEATLGVTDAAADDEPAMGEAGTSTTSSSTS